jgi:predicted NUDIX family NTP pyrophosphohydrolase
MSLRSAGILMYRVRDGAIEVLLAHPGGPFWRRRDDGAWTIPTGEIGDGETPEAAARREFREEIGVDPAGTLRPLGAIRQRAGTDVEAFALEGDFDIALLSSNTFEIEWPPRSGRRATFPEVDRVGWFALPIARTKILEAQQPLLDRLVGLEASAR